MLIYLEDGRAKPVRTRRSDVTRGWVPGNSTPRWRWSTRERHIWTVGRWLAHAETMGLVARTETHRGWMPQFL